MRALFLPLLAVRFLGALLSSIPDCDEVFNYWEPMHYLVYGHGLQTWEYSPVYALRSYTYLLPQAALATVVNALTSDKVKVFYAVRCMMGAVSAACEVRFVCRLQQVAGSDVALLTWALLLTSAGMFHAAVAFLPSTFCMYLVMLAWSCWFGSVASAKTHVDAIEPDGRGPRIEYAGAIWSIAAAALLGWPFVCVVAAPLAVDAILHLGLATFIRHCVCAAATLLLPSVAFDSFLYGRVTVAFLNILLYNYSPAHGSGSQLCTHRGEGCMRALEGVGLARASPLLPNTHRRARRARIFSSPLATCDWRVGWPCAMASRPTTQP